MQKIYFRSLSSLCTFSFKDSFSFKIQNRKRQATQMNFCSTLSLKIILYFWPYQLLVSIRVGTKASPQLWFMGSVAPQHVGSQFPNQPGMEATSPALEAGFLTTGPPRKSPFALILLSISANLSNIFKSIIFKLVNNRILYFVCVCARVRVFCIFL